MGKNINPLHELGNEEQGVLPDRSDLSKLYNRSQLNKDNIDITSQSSREMNSEDIVKIRSVGLINLALAVAFSISYLGILLVVSVTEGKEIYDMSPAERLSGFPLGLMIVAPWVVTILLLKRMWAEVDSSLGSFLVAYSFLLLPAIKIGTKVEPFTLGTILYIAGFAFISMIFTYFLIKALVTIDDTSSVFHQLKIPLGIIITTWAIGILT